MSDWAGIGWGDRWRGLHPGWQTGAVFAVVAALTLIVPNSLVERVVVALDLPPPAAPPIGLFGRLAFALAAGWLAAMAYALGQWVSARRPSSASNRATAGPLTVEPLAAERELGARFDDSPYLAPSPPSPPTPDARLDPDSTLADPRWQAGEDKGLGDWEDEWDRKLAEAPDLPQDDGQHDLDDHPFPFKGEASAIDREEDWDREVPDRADSDGRVFADHPTDPSDPAAQPGNGAEQWDGPAEPVGLPSEDAVPEDRWTVAPADELDARDRALEERREAAAEPEPEPIVAALPDRDLDNGGPSVAELIERLNALAAGGARLPARARTGGNEAAERLAEALRALRAPA